MISAVTAPLPKALRLLQNKQGRMFNFVYIRPFESFYCRAAMFLIPILGINFLLLPIRPSGGSSFEYFYDIVSTIFSSFQGAFYSNSSVIPSYCFFRSTSELPTLLPKWSGQTNH